VFNQLYRDKRKLAQCLCAKVIDNNIKAGDVIVGLASLDKQHEKKVIMAEWE
jgi:hypothetical protein